MSNTLTKQCTKCGDVKVLTEFNKHKNRPLGVQQVCKICTSEYDKQYYIKNRDKKIEQSKQYHVDNRASILETKKHWYNNNKDAHLVYCKQYYLENRESKLAYFKQYNTSNREAISAYKKQHNKEVVAPRNARLLAKVRRLIKRLPEHKYPRFADIIMLSSKLSRLCWYSDIDDFVTTHNTKGI